MTRLPPLPAHCANLPRDAFVPRECIRPGESRVVIDGGEGEDTVHISTGYRGSVDIDGGPGNDTVTMGGALSPLGPDGPLLMLVILVTLAMVAVIAWRALRRD